MCLRGGYNLISITTNSFPETCTSAQDFFYTNFVEKQFENEINVLHSGDDKIYDGITM